MLTELLIASITIPLLGFACSLALPRRWENGVYTIAITTTLLEFATLFILSCQWLYNSATPILAHTWTLYSGLHYTFAIDLYFDKLSLIFMGMATITTALVFIFSKYYMHREPGFKRFYSTTLLFFVGLCMIILAGNFESLLLGWEIIGISSVLLIAFYRDRFLPARNALKVFSVYRIADAFLIAAIWYAHHIFEKNISFSELTALEVNDTQIAILGILFLVVALIKSAQFPFSYWLPRAMEGPTTSSAIFYGALSVHMGVFLLLRTFPLWHGSMTVRIVVAGIGIITAIVASTIARVQSSIKTQIAYASITQIGIIFVEIALGLHWLALIHFISNASLRTYQLLISPSIVSYLVHDQFFHFSPPPQRIQNTLLGKLRASIYILSIKEWNMNTEMSRRLWIPLKSIGRAFAFLERPVAQLISLITFFVLIAAISIKEPSTLTAALVSTAAAVIGIVFFIRAYATKRSLANCWNLIMLGHLFEILFFNVLARPSPELIALYSAGLVVAFFLGHICLRYLKQHGEQTTLQDYHGSIYTFTRLGTFFLIISLLYMVFPISPTFLAQDILLSSIPHSHYLQMILFCVSYVLVGVSIMRLYTKSFFGPHKSNTSEIAYKSS